MNAQFKSGDKILVTGGAGFVGSHVVDRALSEGASVTVLDNLYTGKTVNFQHHRTNPRFTFVNHNVIHDFPAEILATKWNYIFHLACAASPVHYQADPIATTLTCVNGTNNVLKLAVTCDCPVLIASTSEVYGDPQVHPQPENYVGHVSCNGIRACYDEGKRAGESLAFDYNRKHGAKIRVARIFNTYGPRMCADDGRIVSNFVVQALTNRDITIFGTGEYTRAFQYVSDLVEGFWRLITHPTETGPVNLGNPGEFSVKQAADLIASMIPETTSKITYLDATQDDPKQRRPDITKAKQVLGWEPTIKFEDGLKPTIQAFRSQITPPFADRVLCVCNPLLDISAHVDQAFLDTYGLKAGAAGLCEEKQLPIYGELKAMKDVMYIPGGSGLNTARVAQWMAQAPQGRFVSYAGAIADDANGKVMKKSAEQEGVDMALMYDTKSGNPTGTCAVCIVGKERALLANLGAANSFNADHLKSSRLNEILDDVSVVYLTGFTLTNSTSLLKACYERASRHKAQIAMNLSAPFIMQFFADQLSEVFPFIDLIFSNEDEAEAFANMQKFDEPKNLKKVAMQTAKLPKKSVGPRIVVFTAGKDAAVWANSESGETGEVAVPLIDSSKIIDTNGAGDAFVGGFLAAYAQRKSMDKCILAGHYSAGVIIQHDGCTFPAKPAYQI